MSLANYQMKKTLEKILERLEALEDERMTSETGRSRRNSSSRSKSRPEKKGRSINQIRNGKG